MNEFLINNVYIAPYNDIAIATKKYLDKYNINFIGYLDKYKATTSIEKKSCIVIITTPNFHKIIREELSKHNQYVDIQFIYCIIKNNKFLFTKNVYRYEIYSKKIKFISFLINIKKSLSIFIKKMFLSIKKMFLSIKKMFLLINSYLYKKGYFLPLFFLKSLTNKENQQDIFEILIKSKQDNWLKQNKDIHKGKRCFILATGPSLNKLDLSKIKNEYTIGVNGIYKIADPINLDYYIYVSEWYWKYHIDGIKNLKCKRKFLPIHFSEYLNSNNPTSWINILRPRYYTKLGYKQKVPIDFSLNPHEFFYAGGTVIFLALQLAYYLGFKEVIILGLDHTYRKDDYKNKKHGGYFYNTTGGDNAHFDQEYTPEGVDVHVDLEAMEHGYVIAKNIFEKSGRKILNASPNTMLDIFEKIEYDKLF